MLEKSKNGFSIGYIESISYNLDMPTLYIDADSLPKTHRAIVLRRIMKDHMDAFFVADRKLSDVLVSIEEDTKALRDPYRGKLEKEELKAIKSNIKMIVVESGVNSADDYLVSIATAPGLAITHDIPLASRLIEKGLLVIDDRGREFTSDNIKELLSYRAINNDFRDIGVAFAPSGSFDSRTINAFANCFDSMLYRLEAN